MSSLFKPDSTNMANVAHFMCELATDPKTWDDWKGKLPVVVNGGGQDALASPLDFPRDGPERAEGSRSSA